jgi:hypothetical protein
MSGAGFVAQAARRGFDVRLDIRPGEQAAPTPAA